MKAKELRDMAVSALVLAVAFGIAMSGGFSAFQQPDILVVVIGINCVVQSLPQGVSFRLNSLPPLDMLKFN